MKFFFKPRNIAVVGASQDPAKPGRVLIKNLIDYGYQGEVIPVNPSGGQISGRKVFASLNEIPQPVDLAVFCIPNHLVENVIGQINPGKVKGIIIISSGFKETGEFGRQSEERIRFLLKQRGIRAVGPNCMGIYNVSDNLNATHFPGLPRLKGNISFISQSGAYGGIIFHSLKERGIGLSKFISIGNQLDIGHTDWLEYLGNDPATQVIGLFIETLKDGRRFLDIARRVAAKKPIVVFKAGRSESGTRAALSHTGSMAGNFNVFRSAMKQSGVLLAENTEEFFDALHILSIYHHSLPKNNNAAIVTISGGPSVIAGDVCEEVGINVPAFSPTVQQKISRLLPAFGANSNPVDMTPQIKPENYEPCVDLIARQPQIGGIIALNVNLDLPQFARAFIKAGKKYQKPIAAVLVDDPLLSQEFRQHHIPAFPTPERAVRAYRCLLDYRQIRKNLKTKKAKNISFSVLQSFSSLQVNPRKHYTAAPSGSSVISNKKYLGEHESKKILKRYGIPVTKEVLCSSEKESVKAARQIGYPVVLKIASEKIIHKSEAGGVMLNIKNEAELKKAVKRILRCVKRSGIQTDVGKPCVLVQKMITGGQEIIIGGQRDAIFGPVILFGLGGIFTEILKDFSLRVCPITRPDAAEMINKIKGNRILQGYRGKGKANLKAIIDTLLKISSLLMIQPEIKELDINPAIVDTRGITTVDARIIKSGLK